MCKQTAVPVSSVVESNKTKIQVFDGHRSLFSFLVFVGGAGLLAVQKLCFASHASSRRNFDGLLLATKAHFCDWVMSSIEVKLLCLGSAAPKLEGRLHFTCQRSISNSFSKRLSHPWWQVRTLKGCIPVVRVRVRRDCISQRRYPAYECRVGWRPREPVVKARAGLKMNGCAA